MALSKPEIILKAYDITRYWLEYAEKKNTLLFTVVAFEMAVLKFFEKQLFQISFNSTFLLLIFSFIVALISLYPRTDRFVFTRRFKSQTNEKVNIFFYNDIKNFDTNSFIKTLAKQYDINFEDKQLAEDLCEQVIILSKITSSKFIFFKLAFFLAILGQISLLIMLATS